MPRSMHKVCLKKIIIIALVLYIASTLAVSVAQSSNNQGNTTGTEAVKYRYAGVIGSRVLVAKITGVIDEATRDYIYNVISKAEETHSLVVIELNTPGGLLDAAFDIVLRIDRAKVPVVGYVVDKWAESAGSLILVCTHIAAMQPGTIIGSMQPIEYNPTTGTYKPVNESKIINPILKFIEVHAGNKGHNVTVIKKFVLQNLNLDAREALKLHVIDYIADNLNQLLEEINGTTVKLPLTGLIYKIDTSNAIIEYCEPQLRNRLAHMLSDPMLSSLLLTLGLMIILFSLLSGNLHVTPIGVLLLLLGLMGSGFNINATSIFLLILGTILLAVELFVTPGFGILGGTGIVMLALGIALLPVSQGYSFSKEYAQMFAYTAYGMGGVLGAFTGVAIYKVLQAKKRKPFSWEITGKVGRAIDDIKPGSEGFVIIEGEYWRARSDEEIKVGEKVIVIGKEGPVLIVKKYVESSSESRREKTS